MYQPDRYDHIEDDKRIWRFDGIQDFGSGGKFKYEKVKIGELYYKICQILYAGSLLQCTGIGNFARHSFPC